jgi:hypothetical protein
MQNEWSAPSIEHGVFHLLTWFFTVMVSTMKTLRRTLVMLSALLIAVLPTTALAAVRAHVSSVRPIAGRWVFAVDGTYATDMSGGFNVSGGATQYITNVSGTLLPSEVETSCGTGTVSVVGRFPLYPIGHNTYSLAPKGHYNLVKATVIHDGTKLSGTFGFTVVAPRGGHNTVYSTGGDIYYDGRQCDVILFAKL